MRTRDSQLSTAKFLQNSLFRGSKGADASYLLQNVIASARTPGTRAHHQPPALRPFDPGPHIQAMHRFLHALTRYGLEKGWGGEEHWESSPQAAPLTAEEGESRQSDSAIKREQGIHPALGRKIHSDPRRPAWMAETEHRSVLRRGIVAPPRSR